MLLAAVATSTFSNVNYQGQLIHWTAVVSYIVVPTHVLRVTRRRLLASRYIVAIRLVYRNPFWRLEEFRTVPLDHRKSCRRLAQVRRVCFDHRKEYRRLAEVGRVRF